jgi:hypothetical protein
MGCVPSAKTVTTGGAGGNPNAPSRWPFGAFPKTTVISEDFTNAEELELRRAATSWSTTVGGGANFFSIPVGLVTDRSGVADLDQLLDGEFGIYKSAPWHPDLPSMALAVTQLFGVRHNHGSASEYVEIIEADILMNFTWPYAPTVNGGYDLFSVSLHEMGHFLGLNHVFDFSLDSVMFTSIGQGTTFPSPGAHDVLVVKNRYQMALMAGGARATRQAVTREPASTRADVLKSGNGVRILIELYSDGHCIHRENGIPVLKHQVDFTRH